MGEIWLERLGFGLFECKYEVAAEGFGVKLDLVLDGNAVYRGGFGECNGQFGGGGIGVVGGAELDFGEFGAVGAVVAQICTCFECKLLPCRFDDAFPFGCAAVVACFEASRA